MSCFSTKKIGHVNFWNEKKILFANLLCPGANPTIASYSASIVKIYNTASSLVRLEIKKYVLLPRKTLYVVVVNSKVVGLAPGNEIFFIQSEIGSTKFKPFPFQRFKSVFN
jgi:hypothetical protein